jgi:hypothetical protein
MSSGWQEGEKHGRSMPGVVMLQEEGSGSAQTAISRRILSWLTRAETFFSASRRSTNPTPETAKLCDNWDGSQ